MSGRAPAIGALVAAATLWGVTFVLTKPVLEDFTASQVSLLRFLFALPVLLALAWRVGGLRVPLRLVLPLALTGVVGYYFLTTLGLERASASAGAFVQALGPVLTALLAVVFLRERPGALVVGGIALAVAGACLLAWKAVRIESPLGLAFFLLGTLSWAAYIVLVHRIGDRLSAIAVTALPTLLAAFMLAPPAALDPWGGARAGSWLLLIALSLAGGVLGLLLWNYGVARVPASYAGIFSNVSPVVSVLAAAIVLDESVGSREALGGAIVILGAVLASTRRAAVTTA